MDSREVAQNQSWASSGPKGHVIFSMKSNWMSKAFLLRLCSWRSLSWCCQTNNHQPQPGRGKSLVRLQRAFSCSKLSASACCWHSSPQKSWHTLRIGALTPPTKSTPWNHNCRFHTSHRQNSRQNSRVCFVVCFEGLFRGMFRGSVSGYVSGVCFVKVELPSLIQSWPPQKNTNPYIYIYTYT